MMEANPVAVQSDERAACDQEEIEQQAYKRGFNEGRAIGRSEGEAVSQATAPQAAATVAPTGEPIGALAIRLAKKHMVDSQNGYKRFTWHGIVSFALDLLRDAAPTTGEKK
ncbi:hypothetical protein [Paraburkholderia sp. MM6662-R1]|uniref:hypothetical protein n=1 Tax=Paraburkholderia sp. MM6662-R1 TaxID=2991066 RepID=UPI003D1BCC7C